MMGFYPELALGLVFWQSRVKALDALTLFNATFV